MATITLNFEMFVDGPTPPGPPDPFVDGDPYIIRGTHRAYRGSDSKQTAWVRTESGKLDMTDLALTVEISPYSRGGGSGYDYGIGSVYRPWVLDAVSPEIGKVEFTAPAAGVVRDCNTSLFKFFVKADGRVVYTGLLEFV